MNSFFNINIWKSMHKAELSKHFFKQCITWIVLAMPNIKLQMYKKKNASIKNLFNKVWMGN